MHGPMTPPSVIPDAAECLEQCARLGKRLVVVAAGGGSAAIAALAGVPGASRVVSEGVVPHSREAFAAFARGAPEQFCSPRSARRLAMAAWERCRQQGADAQSAVGIACTASLATTEAKRGEHRIVVAVQTLGTTSTAGLVLIKGRRSRAEEEAVAAALLLDHLVAVVAVPPTGPRLGPLLLPGETLSIDDVVADPSWQDSLSGCGGPVRLAGPSDGRLEEVLFPGSFDPLHDGHRAMRRIAARITGREVAYELSLRNVDKPSLDYAEIRARARGFAGAPAWLTAAATFVEKVDLFPGAVFVVGADTFVRLWEPRYHGDCPDRVRASVTRIAEGAGGFVVFGRARDGMFTDPAALPAPEPLRRIATFVPEADFRDDVSSTILRRTAGMEAD